MMEAQNREQKQILPTLQIKAKTDPKFQSMLPEASKVITENFVKINGEKATKIYEKVSLLGKGGFAECFQTRQKDTQREAATKIIPKKLLDSPLAIQRLANEIKLHKSLHHENIVEFYSHFEDAQNVYINLQLCQKGCINDILRIRYNFSVPQVQSFTYGICQGLKYLHSRKIIHRDLKLGNILINEKFSTKIADLGLACKLQFDKENKRTVCGTPNYIAPQVLEGKGYHYEVDVWALGIMIYILFFTNPPFESEDPYVSYQKIRKCQYQIPRFCDAPSEAIDLIKKILVCNPANRLTIDEILDSPFMKLGGSIPIGLPPSAIKRAPSKKQLQNWPSIPTKDPNEMKSQMNTTVLGFLGFSKKSQKNSNQATLKLIVDQKSQEEGTIFCRNLDEIQNCLITFDLNNGNYGVYNTSTGSTFSCKLKDSKMIESLKKLNLDDSGTLKEQQIQINECPHKMILNLKQKQLLKGKHQAIQSQLDKDVTVAKINLYKDVILARLSNRSIQVLFKEKDGFLVSANRCKIQYFSSFEDFDKGKQVIIGAVVGFGQKQNKANSSTPNMISSIFKVKNQKHHLSVKKITYLKAILVESMTRNSRKSC